MPSPACHQRRYIPNRGRGGRAIRIVVEMQGECGVFPLFDSSTPEARFRRPAQAIETFVFRGFDRDIFSDALFLKAFAKYWLKDMNITKKRRLVDDSDDVEAKEDHL